MTLEQKGIPCTHPVYPVSAGVQVENPEQVRRRTALPSSPHVAGYSAPTLGIQETSACASRHVVQISRAHDRFFCPHPKHSVPAAAVRGL